MNRTEIIEEAKRLRREGWTLARIAARLGISISSVARYTENRIDVRPHPRQEVFEQLAPKLRELYLAGVPSTSIAVELGVTVVTVCEWMKRLGLKRRSRKIYVTDDMRAQVSKQFSKDPDGAQMREIVRLYSDEQLSTVEISQRVGVSPTTISAWLRKAGVATREQITQRTREKLRAANLGDKRYNWKGGISGQQRLDRGSFQMRLAREACFKRDDYTCRCCQQRGGKLNAHHVWPFQRFPQWKYEVWNLVTLCKACHDGFHKAAGGHVHIAIGPFFTDRTQVREQPSVYEVPLAA